jgi:hypothetical protein
MIRRAALISVGFSVLLFTSALFAQVAGEPNRVRPESSEPVSADAAAAKPFASFSGIATGTYNFVNGACPGVTCPSGKICECLSTTGATLKATGLGAATFAANINVDFSSLTPNGAGDGFCDFATGPATIKAANGDTISLDLTTHYCVGLSFVNFEVEGGWIVVAGTGKLAAAAGTGVITLTGAQGFIPQTDPVAVSMNGAFHK